MWEQLDDFGFVDDINFLSHTDTNAGEGGQAVTSCGKTWSYSKDTGDEDSLHNPSHVAKSVRVDPYN